MEARNPKVWARVDPDLRAWIRDEAERSYDGNESMVVRLAIKRLRQEVIEARQRATELAVTAIPDREAVA